MSKHRTSKAARKRFKVTAGGKLMHRSQKLRHLRSTKSKRQVRSLKRLKTVTGVSEKKIQRMLGLK